MSDPIAKTYTYITTEEAFHVLDSLEVEAEMSHSREFETEIGEANLYESSEDGCQNDSDEEDDMCTCLRVRKKDCQRLHNVTGRGKTNHYLRSSRPCSAIVTKPNRDEKQRNKRDKSYDTLCQGSSTDQMDKDLGYDSGSRFQDYTPPISRWQEFQEKSYSDDFSEDEIECPMDHPKKSVSLPLIIWIWFRSLFVYMWKKTHNVARRIRSAIFSLSQLPWYIYTYLRAKKTAMPSRRRCLGRSKKSVRLPWIPIWKLFQGIFIYMSIKIPEIARRITGSLYYVASNCYYKFPIYLRGHIISLSQLPWYIYNYLNTKKRSYLFVTSARDAIASKKKTKLLCYRNFYLILLFFLVLLAIGFDRFYMRHDLPKIIVPIPKPFDSGIYNGYPLYLDAEHSRIPAWYMYPNQQKSSNVYPIKKPLKGMTPAIMVLRNTGHVGAPELVNLYQILSSLGYHIVIPTDVLSEPDILKTWKWIKSQTDAKAYMWGYGMNATNLSQNAERFCKYQMPPNGVIIAKEVDSDSVYQTMEIWSCNCKGSSSRYSNVVDLKYNYVNCPIVFREYYVNDVYTQVVACVERVN